MKTHTETAGTPVAALLPGQTVHRFDHYTGSGRTLRPVYTEVKVISVRTYDHLGPQGIGAATVKFSDGKIVSFYNGRRIEVL